MTRWLRCAFPVPAAAMRLVCLPYAGAGAATYAGWSVPGDLPVEVWAVQPPGRENRWGEEPARRAGPVVDAVVAELAPLLDRPVVLFGHSMGALLAFEVARRLRAQRHQEPAHLFLSAFRAADLPPWRPPASTLPDDALLRRVDEMMGPARNVVRDRNLLVAMIPTLRVDLELCETYTYVAQAPLAVPMTCFAAVDDPEVRVDEMAGWQRHTSGAFRLHTFTGGHLFLRDQEPEVLTRIATDIADAAVAASAGGEGDR